MKVYHLKVEIDNTYIPARSSCKYMLYYDWLFDGQIWKTRAVAVVG